jgi:hypothetical protein
MVFCRQNQFIVGFDVLKGPGHFHILFVQYLSLDGLEKLKKKNEISVFFNQI